MVVKTEGIADLDTSNTNVAVLEQIHYWIDPIRPVEPSRYNPSEKVLDRVKPEACKWHRDINNSRHAFHLFSRLTRGFD